MNQTCKVILFLYYRIK